MPISSRSGEWTSFINALFTSTSSVCVTGLVVVDTGTYWSVYGQIVMLCLVEVGGLGFMSFATMFFVMAGKRITIKDRILIQSSVNMDSLFVLLCTEPGVAFEAVVFEVLSAFGTVGLTMGLTPDLSVGGKIAISLTMFIGRLGPLTIAYAIARSEKHSRENVGNFTLPEGNVMIG